MLNDALYAAGLGSLITLPCETIPTSPIHHNMAIMYPVHYSYMGRIDPIYNYSRIYLLDYQNVTSLFDYFHRYPNGSGLFFYIDNYFYVLKDFFFLSHMSFNIMFSIFLS